MNLFIRTSLFFIPGKNKKLCIKNIIFVEIGYFGMSFKESITNEELNLLPLGAFEGEIVVVDSAESMAAACDYLEKCALLGFDTETRPSFAKGKINKMSLIQLASGSKAFLLRMNKTSLPERMLAILENENVTKVGASIRDDIKGIQKQFPFTPGGFTDIQSIVHEFGISDISVRKLSAIVLGIRISKAQRLSNWEAHSLTPAQQAYAATDAWACRQIYEKLKNSRK